MSMVQTKDGLIERHLLDVFDIVEEQGNARSIATEWRLKETGELVRRDCHVAILAGQAISGEQVNVG